MVEIRDVSPELIILIALIIITLLLIAAILFASYKIGDAPGSGALIALIGLGAVAFLILRKH